MNCKLTVADGNRTSSWGYGVTVYCSDRKPLDGSRESTVAYERYLEAVHDVTWAPEKDIALVELVNKICDGGAKWNARTPCDRLAPSIFLPLSKDDSDIFPALQNVSETVLRARLSLLLVFNGAMLKTLPYIHFTSTQPSWSLGAKIKKVSHLIFQGIDSAPLAPSV